MKKIIALLLAATLLIGAGLLTGCGKKDNASVGINDAATQNDAQVDGAQANDAVSLPAGNDPVATITMEDGRTITVQLRPDAAPNTVNNFISLANKGFYDGVIFHRVIQGFMIQGGDPEGTGYGGPGYAIQGEFDANGIANPLPHVRGTISMGRQGGNMDSAGSQFFICQQDYDYGNGQYAAFGTVTSGMDVVDDIAAVQTDANDRPLQDVKIRSITVDTKGITYPEPVTMAE